MSFFSSYYFLVLFSGLIKNSNNTKLSSHLYKKFFEKLEALLGETIEI